MAVLGVKTVTIVKGSDMGDIIRPSMSLGKLKSPGPGIILMTIVIKGLILYLKLNPMPPGTCTTR